jgi:ribosomal protein S18 acetylase RimI-like enzyme
VVSRRAVAQHDDEGTGVTPPVKIRDAEAADWPWMRKAWRETFLHGSLAVHGADKQSYFDEMTRLFAAIAPNASARIACDPADDDNLLGFACFEGATLFYIYVLKDFRRDGIVALLLDQIPITAYAFSTMQFVRRLRPRERGWKFAPSFTFNLQDSNGRPS